MKAKAHSIGWLTNAVVTMMATLCGVHGAEAATGGTIYFTGMIVAPPLEVSSAVIPPPPSARVVTQANATASTVAVTFKVPPGAVSSLDVLLLVNDATAPRVGAVGLGMLAARFVDGSGHMFAATPNGQYHVGSNGATLLLGAKSGDQASASKAVTVVLSYN